MVSVVDVASLGKVVWVRGVNEVSYLVLCLVLIDVLVLIFDLGFDIEEGIACILLSSLSAVLLQLVLVSARVQRC